MKSTVADYRYRVLCLRIVPRNGAPVRLTHHPRRLLMGNGTLYLPHSGYDLSAYTSTASFSASVVDLQGIANAGGITRDQLASGYFDGATCYLFATTWRTPVEDEEPIVASTLGRTVLDDDRYRIEEMSLIDKLSQTIGDTYAAGCQKTFGGQEFGGCKKPIGPLTAAGSITAVTDALTLRDAARSEAADYFAVGLIRFTSGNNAGLPGKEIKAYASNGTITLFEPFQYPVQAGDAYEMQPGCRKGLEHCKAWGNVLNFGGFSFVPTASQYSEVGTK